MFRAVRCWTSRGGPVLPDDSPSNPDDGHGSPGGEDAGCKGKDS